MKKIIVSLLLICTGIISRACPACEAAQPRVLKGLIHGSGPTSNWDYVAGIVTLLIVIFVLFFLVLEIISDSQPETLNFLNLKH